MIVLRNKEFGIGGSFNPYFPKVLQKVERLKKCDFSFLKPFLEKIGLTRVPFTIEQSTSHIIIFSGRGNDSIKIDKVNKTVNISPEFLKYLKKKFINLEQKNPLDLFNIAFRQMYNDIFLLLCVEASTVEKIGVQNCHKLGDRFNTEIKKSHCLTKLFTEAYSPVERRLFSKKLPDSRIGIGWIQEKLGKNDSEKYFKKGQKAADDSYERGDDDEKVIKKSKRKAGNSVILDKSGKPILEGSIAGGVGYLATKSPKFIEGAAKIQGIDLKIPPQVKNYLSKHSGKIAVGAGLIAAGRYVPKIYEQQKAVRTGMEINTKNRLEKSKKKKENDNTEK